jgi:hypothetical protein
MPKTAPPATLPTMAMFKSASILYEFFFKNALSLSFALCEGVRWEAGRSSGRARQRRRRILMIFAPKKRDDRAR